MPWPRLAETGRDWSARGFTTMKWKKSILFFLLGALVAVVASQVFQAGRESYTVRAQGRLLPAEETVIRVSKVSPTRAESHAAT